MEHQRASIVADLRQRIARFQVAPRRGRVSLPFGLRAIDGVLPEGGLGVGALHEVAGAGAEIEHGAAAALLIAGILAQSRGPVLWVLQQRDFFAPALAGVGLHPDRVIYAEAGTSAQVLLVIEEGLRHRGLAGVVGELSSRLTLTASRRLQLAAEQSGVPGFALRRSRRHDDPMLAEPNAAATRWRVSSLTSPPPVPHAPGTPGLARPRWRLDLLRCRGGTPASWIVEACDAKGRLRLAADLAHGSDQAPIRRPAAG